MNRATAERPLEGRTIVVTRARAQAQRFAELLEAAGARVLQAPTIVIEPPASWEPLDTALAALESFTWVIFTSVNGVAMVDRRLVARGMPWAAIARKRVAAIGGKGLFVREIEEMLLAGALDCAVHSLKDLPAQIPAGLCLAAFPEREDPRDVLVTRERSRFEDLRAGARLGTGSPRRRALALALRPDLVVEPIRGNVDTRLSKLERDGWDGVLLAAAGLKRLGLVPSHVQPLDPEVFAAVAATLLAVAAFACIVPAWRASRLDPMQALRAE